MGRAFTGSKTCLGSKTCIKTRAEALEELRKQENASYDGNERKRFLLLRRDSKTEDHSKVEIRAMMEFLDISAAALPEWGEGWSVSVEQPVDECILTY